MAEHEELIKQVQELENQEDDKSSPKKKKKNLRHIINILLVLIITAAAIAITISDNFWEILNNLKKCDYRFLLIVIGIIVGSVIIRALILFFFARLYTKKYHLHQALAVDFVGTFYSAVTPGASGGQVMQAYTFKKQGIPISSAVSMLAMNSIIYQIVLTVYGILAFAVKHDIIMKIGNAHLGQIGNWSIDLPIWALTIFGFLLNVGVIFLVLLMGYWKGFHNFIMGPMISLLNKMKIVKDPDKSRENLRVQVENFKVEMRRLFSNIPFTILVTIMHISYFTIRFSVPYFIGLSLGNESTLASFFDCVLLCNYHQMITGIIPIPGSAGVSELVFRLLFVNSRATASNSFFYVNAAIKYPDKVMELANAWETYWNSGEQSKIPEYYRNMIEANKMTFEEAATQSVTNSESAAMANAALLLWRSITFIIPVTISGFVTAFYRASPKEEANEGRANRQTYIDLQRDTYIAREEELETMAETSRLTREEILKRLRSIGGKKKPKKKKKHKEDDNIITYDDVNIDDEDNSI